MRVYAHGLTRAVPAGLELGIRGAWIQADALHDQADLLDACRTHPDFRYILEIYPTEGRLLDRGGIFEHQMRQTVQYLHDQGVSAQCSGIQWGDEFWSAVYTGRLPAEHWPSLTSAAGPAWSHRQYMAAQLGARMMEFRRVWTAVTGFACPPVGLSETGGCAPPEFDGQDYWATNIYLGRPGWYLPTIESVHRLYSLVWAVTRLPIMPCLGMFAEGPHSTPDVVALAQAYLPVLAHPRVWAAGLFLVHHPSQYDARHAQGRGIIDGVDPSYPAAARWLCAHLALRPELSPIQWRLPG